MNRWPLLLCLSIAAVGGCGRSSAPPRPAAAPVPPLASATKVPAESAPPEKPEPAQEVQPEKKPITPAGRVILFSPVGPLLFDLLVTIDGKPLPEVRQRSVGELVERLTKATGAALTWEAVLSDPRFSLGENPPNRQDRKILIATLDLNRDQLVQAPEAADFYARADSIGPALAFTVSAQSWSDREASRLWHLADLNSDGAVDAGELSKLSTSLQNYDADGNELLDAGELTAGAMPDGRNTLQTARRSASSNSKLAVLCDAAFRGEAIAYTIEELYPSEQRDESPLSTVTRLIAAVDKNLNGRIDGREPLALTQAAPLGKIHVAFGAGVPPTEAITLEWLDPELGSAAMQSIAANALVSELAGNRLLLERTEFAGDPPGTGTPLAAQFGSLDRDANGYLEKGELPEGDMNIDRAFRAADINSDGKLYRTEVDEFVGWQQGLRTAGVRLDVSSAADPLFGILDTSNDGRLSQRELRGAASALSQYDRNGDGRLEMAELPVAIRLKFGRVAPAPRPDTTNPGKLPANSDVAAIPPAESKSDSAPEWFLRMDLNGDGDLSPAEFLGTSQQFDVLDTDRDGFIVATEAQRSK